MNGACIEKSESSIEPGEQPGIKSQVRRIYWLLLLIAILVIVIGYIMYKTERRKRIVGNMVKNIKKPGIKKKKRR